MSERVRLIINMEVEYVPQGRKGEEVEVITKGAADAQMGIFLASSYFNNLNDVQMQQSFEVKKVEGGE